MVPNGQNVTLSLGRGREKFWISANDNAYSWGYTGTRGESPKIRPYPGSSRPEQRESFWWWNNSYTPNGLYRRSFSMPPAIAAASEAMMGKRWQTADKRTLRLALPPPVPRPEPPLRGHVNQRYARPDRDHRRDAP